MAYEPTVWASGDTVTAEKLNKIEQGIVNGADIKTNISNPVDGQTLRYDAASGKWVNAEAPSGGSETMVIDIVKYH